MTSFVEFERQVLRVLLRSQMQPDQIEELLATASFVSCEHTGVGYFLTVRHSAVSTYRVVCSEPIIEGRAIDIECGFVAFLEAGELTLECHSWGDSLLPRDLRQRSLAIHAAWWWLWCGECSQCGQWWLVAQEERQNDVFCLRRLDADEVNDLLQNNVWPSDFDNYESLLRLGHDAGVMFRFADPEEASSLRWTIADLAKARPESE